MTGEVQEWRWGDWGGAAGVAVGGWGVGGRGRGAGEGITGKKRRVVVGACSRVREING